MIATQAQASVIELCNYRLRLSVKASATFAALEIGGMTALGVVAAFASSSLSPLAPFLGTAFVAASLTTGVIMGKSFWHLHGKLDEQIAEAIRALRVQNDAISSAAQVNINSGSGKMKVQNQPISYTVRGKVSNQLNLTVAPPEPRTIEIPAHDIVWWADQLANGYKHSKSNWLGKQLPYSKLEVTWAVYKALMDGWDAAFDGRGERAAGRLKEDYKNGPALVKLLERTYPGASRQGIVIELPAQASA